MGIRDRVLSPRTEREKNDGVPDNNEPVMTAVACTPRGVDFALAMAAVASDRLMDLLCETGYSFAII